MNVPALNLCDVTELGFSLGAPPNTFGVGNDGGNDDALSFVPIERAHRSSVSDPILKIRPRPSRAFAASAAHRRPAHNKMNVDITSTPIDDDEEEEVALISSSSRAKTKSSAAITPTKTKTRSMKTSYKLVVRNSKRPKEVRPTVNQNAAAATTATDTTATRRPCCSTPEEV